MANDFWILLAMVIYFAAMLSIGFIYSKRSNSSSKEYFAGGRGVGLSTFHQFQGKNHGHSQRSVRTSSSRT